MKKQTDGRGRIIWNYSVPGQKWMPTKSPDENCKVITTILETEVRPKLGEVFSGYLQRALADAKTVIVETKPPRKFDPEAGGLS